MAETDENLLNAFVRDNLPCPERVRRLETSVRELLSEVSEIRKNIIDAHEHDPMARRDPKYDATYQHEIARIDALVGRANRALVERNAT